MGKVKEAMAPDPEGWGQIVLHVDKDGWYGWVADYWWDRQSNHHGRMEVGRFADLLDALAARDAFNQMMHGKTTKPIY